MKIPRRQAGTEKLTAETGVVQRTPQAESMVSRAGAELGGVVTEVAQKFENIYNKNQLDEANLQAYDTMVQIDAEANADPDIDNPDVQKQYIDQMAKAKEDIMSGIEMPMVKNEFDSKFEMARIKNTIQIQAYGRSKSLDKSRGLTVNKVRKLKEKYSFGDIASRNEIMKEMNNAWDTLAKDGAVTYEVAENKKEADKEEFILSGALKDTELYGAEKVLESIDDYDVKDKEKLISEVKRVGLQQKKKADLNQSLIYQEGQDQAIETVGNPELSYIAKLDTIQQLEKEGKLDATTAKVQEANLYSANKVDAVTRVNEMANIIRLIGDIDVGKKAIKNKKKGIELLTKVRDLKNAIVKLNSNGFLTIEDKNDLLLSVTDKTKDEQTEAIKKVSKGISWRYGYNDANKYFKDNLVNDAYRDEALREYFYAVEGKKLSTTEKKAVAKQINISIKNKILGEPETKADKYEVGAIVAGYKFKGGDYRKETNWEKISE